MTRALADERLARTLAAAPLHLIAAGKAAAHMAGAWCSLLNCSPHAALVVGTHRDVPLPSGVEWQQAGHPLPDARSVAAARRALALARGVESDESLVMLLSGGASALLALPADGVSLADKQHVVERLLRGGADIRTLNTVRKHISAIKGGRLAAACRGRAITLAISDVVGDDLSVIGSGPCVPDLSTWSDAAEALRRFVPPDEQPASVRDLMRRGLAGELEDTPKPESAVMQRAEARVIAGAGDAVRGAADVAAQLGYAVVTLTERVTEEARDAAAAWLQRVEALTPRRGPTCVISAGETTVRVTGTGRGGRNQEFALALAPRLAAGAVAAALSAGTDGVDGPTEAAGALVDVTTMARADQLGLSAADHLNDNNSHAFFAALGDLIVTGPTGTNVGDLQIAIL